jgi:hypothetical protein
MGLNMKKFSCLMILAATLSSTAWGACKIPDTPRKMPDGTTAKRAEIVAYKDGVVGKYQADMDAYRACIKAEYEAQLAKYPKGDEDLKKQFLERYTKMNDAAVDTQEEFVGRFNEQLRAFKAAQAAK